MDLDNRNMPYNRSYMNLSSHSSSYWSEEISTIGHPYEWMCVGEHRLHTLIFDFPTNYFIAIISKQKISLSG